MKLILSLVAVMSLSATVASPAVAAVGADPGDGQVVAVQAVPGAEVDVAIDGKSVQRGAGVGSLIGPVSLSVGTHELVFSVVGKERIRTRFSVERGSSNDIVLHRPASVDGAPVVSTYRTPQKPIGPGKARIFLAHTATVPPADVRFDGKVVFSNVANGEFADADVPAGTHRVALLPSGANDDPILGPLTVDLAARTATMVYAVGTPSNGSMNVVTHTVELSSDGSTVPSTIDTGSAGLAASVRVTPFSTGPSQAQSAGLPTTADSGLDNGLVGYTGALTILLVGASMIAVLQRGRRSQLSSPDNVDLDVRVK